ncbi:mitochondrial PGP phosphatase [Xylariales sp. PMI_506]|nr:mitochondrial PGP phosphatase [Xylariales sp. PMI_506]
MNLNLSGSFGVLKLFARPSLCLPHATVSQFSDLPYPLNKALEKQGRQVDIRAIVVDKDDCFAYPETNEIHPPYITRFRQLQKEFPGRRFLIVSNTAGALSYDHDGSLARELEESTGVPVLSHRVKKPGCKDEIMAHFRQHPETGVTQPSQIAVIGDRLMTDMMLANTMGSWGIWIRNGVAPLENKGIFSKLEYRLASFLQARGYEPSEPTNPFD